MYEKVGESVAPTGEAELNSLAFPRAGDGSVDGQ